MQRLAVHVPNQLRQLRQKHLAEALAVAAEITLVTEGVQADGLYRHIIKGFARIGYIKAAVHRLIDIGRDIQNLALDARPRLQREAFYLLRQLGEQLPVLKLCGNLLHRLWFSHDSTSFLQ